MFTCIINNMSAILETKFHIPQVQANFILRPQLLSMIECNMQGKLTLVTAPAGFGKTTLVSNWLEHMAGGQGEQESPLPWAWLSLDQQDNDPIRFRVVGLLGTCILQGSLLIDEATLSTWFLRFDAEAYESVDRLAEALVSFALAYAEQAEAEAKQLEGAD